jgi:uncharacterized membrane protein
LSFKKNFFKSDGEASRYIASTGPFNDQVKLAIDDAISTILGQQVLKAFYAYLNAHYDITSDEIPYRLDTLFHALEKVFGVNGASTLTRVITRRAYARMGLQFSEIRGYTLQDYLQDAKVEFSRLP